MWPTPRLALLLLGAAGAAIVAGFWGWGPAVATLSWGLLVPVVWDFLALFRRPVPIVDLGGLHQAALRLPFELPLRVQSPGGWLEVAVDWPFGLGGPVPALTWADPHGEVTGTWRAVPLRRGGYEIGAVWTRFESPWRLWARRVIRPSAAQVQVWPDLRGLGLFERGDDPTHIDWKATVRLSKPVAREGQPDRRRSVVLALDAGRLMCTEHDGESKFDAALRALACIAIAADARGDSVGLLVYAEEVQRFVPPLSGSSQADRLLREVGDLEPTAVESDLRRALVPLLGLQRRTLVVVISDVLDSVGAEVLTTAVTELARAHVPMVALLRDPYLDATMARTIAGAAAAFERAAAELVSRNRSVTLDLLRSRGVVAFDSTMRGLASTVVQTYLDADREGQW